MFRSTWRVLFAALASLLLSACSEDFGSYRFRVTIEVETPRGMRSGSSVYEVHYSRFGGSAHADLRGQAVVVEVGDGRELFALLAHGPTGSNTDVFPWLPVSALTGATWGWASTEALQRAPLPEGKVDLSGPLIPTIAFSTDASDPKSFQAVMPENLSAMLGSGYLFRRATLEIVPAGIWPFRNMPLHRPLWLVGEPITLDIARKLPWLDLRGGYLNGGFTCNPGLQTCLHDGNFRRP
ncbi:hypothetical protein SAMN05216304_10689 [Bosea sp. OK403]|nr:hypothetical protein SAMN05216304_10689 [Bosea sp. OK403]